MMPPTSVRASAAQKPRAADTMALAGPIMFPSSTYWAASRMPSPAIVNGESTVARIWIEEPKAIGQNSALAAPIARAVK